MIESVELFTDLYQLTMLQAYFRERMESTAVFDLFVRRLPRRRNFLLACGLGDVLEYLESLRFTSTSIDYLRSLDLFDDDFLESLRELRFTGRVRAVPEGTPVFANEPILEVIAPIAEAQLVETFILNQVTFQTVAASKACRVVQAARGRKVIDFGARRCHGIDAALKAARAFHIAGVDATSNVLAGTTYGLEVAGTMAHSYIEAHEDELEAFRAFASVFPGTVLLVDTFDTVAGVEKVVELARELGDGFRVSGVRLDSGDLVSLSEKSREVLDAAGLEGVQIVASGGLDEYSVERLIDSGARIDAFGVGTRMGVSRDAPSLDSVYKLVEYDGRGRMKLSHDKTTLPGRKQVFRTVSDGRIAGDTIGLADEQHEGEPLLVDVMVDGKRTAAGNESLEAARARARRQVERLPEALRALDTSAPGYPVEISDRLRSERDRLKGTLGPASGPSPSRD